MSRTAEQLPRGRHGIPREEVLASQRGRMLVAMTEAVAERGFAKVTVADVIRRAGVSRETFYQHFSDKDDAFLAALDGAAQLLAGRLVDVIGGRRRRPPSGSTRCSAPTSSRSPPSPPPRAPS